MFTKLSDGSYRAMTHRERREISSQKGSAEADATQIRYNHTQSAHVVLPPSVLSSGAPPQFSSAFGVKMGPDFPGQEGTRSRKVTAADVENLMAFALTFGLHREANQLARALADRRLQRQDLPLVHRLVPLLTPEDADPSLSEAQVGTRVLMSKETVAELLRLAPRGPYPKRGWWGLAGWLIRSNPQSLPSGWRRMRDRLSVAIPQPKTRTQLFVTGPDLEASMDALAQEVNGTLRCVRVPDKETLDAAEAAGVQNVSLGDQKEGDWVVTRDSGLIPTQNPWLGVYFGKSLLAY